MKTFLRALWDELIHPAIEVFTMEFLQRATDWALQKVFNGAKRLLGVAEQHYVSLRDDGLDTQSVRNAVMDRMITALQVVLAKVETLRDAGDLEGMANAMDEAAYVF